jgi:hypothetical protein
MTGYVRGVAIVVCLALPLTAWGHGLRRSSSTVTYYYPAPAVTTYYYAAPTVVQYVPTVTYYVAPVPVPVICPPPVPAPVAPSPAAPNYARPTPAPPSTTALRPALSPAAVTDRDTYYDRYAVANADPARATGTRCSVSFWNLTNHDLTLTVEGQSRVLARGKSLPLDLARRFQWQIEGRNSRNEQVAAGESAVEIVIRR